MSENVNDYYFDSYAHFGIHKEMLSDRVRTLTYQFAIDSNSKMFRDKVILDVGCGTGILSLFAAKCGAKRVYAVEKSGIAKYAKEIIKRNGYSNVITLLEGSIEEVDIPEKVDVIISEWMGYCLFFESMLNSVIFARDRYIKENGTMFPNVAKMFITGIEDDSFYRRKFNFWNDICGFDFEPIKQWALHEPVIQVCPEKQIITDDSKILEIDLNKVKISELEMDSRFVLNPLEPINLYGFLVWFDVEFHGTEQSILLSTSPFEKSTHWGQTLFYLENPIKLSEESEIIGNFIMKPNSKNYRDQDITIQFQVDGSRFIQHYKMR